MNYNKSITTGKLSQNGPLQLTKAMKEPWMESGMDQISQFQK